MPPPFQCADAAVGASAIAPREAAATSVRVSLRNMVVLLDVRLGAGWSFQFYPSHISRFAQERGSRKLHFVRGQFSERIFRCEKHHILLAPRRSGSAPTQFLN